MFITNWSKEISKILWKIYKKRYPTLTSVELFTVIFNDIVEQNERNLTAFKQLHGISEGG